MKKQAGKGKLWSGRFAKPTHSIVEKFTASIGYDARLYKYDIRGSIAHVRMLSKIGILKQSEMKKIVGGLKKIEQEISSGKFIFDDSLEDVHMNIESKLIERLGGVGAKLHTARSRNDQIALDMRMYIKDTITNLVEKAAALQRAAISLAQKYTDVVFPGYTHLQLAQPVLFAHHLLAYVEMLERDKERLRDTFKRADELPLGSGAISGTSIPIDRVFVAKQLGFSRISQNSIDAVSDRDFLIEFMAALSIMAVHFSRLSEELVLWTSAEFGYIKMDDAFCTGSSMLPQKRNPDVAELVRGKTGQFFGGLISLLTLMKGLPLSYNRDMQEDKLPVFRAADAAASILDILVPLVKSLKVNSGRVKETIEGSSVQAIDLAEYLVKKGVPFREAHFIVGRIVRHAEEKNVPLAALGLDVLKTFSGKFGHDVVKMLDPMDSPSRKVSRGGTAPRQVKQRVSYWHRKLNKESG